MSTTTETPVLLPRFCWVAMQQFSADEQKTITDAPSYLEVVISRVANGRIPESSLAYFLYGGTAGTFIGEDLTAMVIDCVNAWWTHIRAETGEFDIHALEPELQDEEVYAERCRADLDQELAALAEAVRR